MSAVDLLPCPFCQKPAELGGFWGQWYCRCTDPDCWAGNHASHWVEDADAIAAWNRRAPVSAGKVKALEWGHAVTTYLDRKSGKELPAAEFWQADTILLRGRYTVMRLVDTRVRGDRESYRLNVGREDQKHPTLDAAKAAAQADYEARILAQLQPGDGWQGIESAPKDGTTVILWVVTEYAPQGHMLWPCKVIYDDWCWEISDNAHLDWDHQIIEDKVITHWMPPPAPPASLPQNNGEG